MPHPSCPPRTSRTSRPISAVGLVERDGICAGTTAVSKLVTLALIRHALQVGKMSTYYDAAHSVVSTTAKAPRAARLRTAHTTFQAWTKESDIPYGKNQGRRLGRVKNTRSLDGETWALHGGASSYRVRDEGLDVCASDTVGRKAKKKKKTACVCGPKSAEPCPVLLQSVSKPYTIASDKLDTCRSSLSGATVERPASSSEYFVCPQ